MDFDFFCLPIIFGCSNSITPDEGQPIRLCPHCHNVAVTSAKKRTWFELFCVPVVPISSKHVWVCSICNWNVKKNGYEPPMPGAAPPPGVYYPPQGQYPPPGQYSPAPYTQHSQGYQHTYPAGQGGH